MNTMFKNESTTMYGIHSSKGCLKSLTCYGRDSDDILKTSNPIWLSDNEYSIIERCYQLPDKDKILNIINGLTKYIGDLDYELIEITITKSATICKSKSNEEPILDWQKEIKQLLESKHCTDSDIEDFINVHPEIKGENVWNYVSDLSAPDNCKGCGYIQLIGFSTPCTRCLRATDYKDYYEKRIGE